ncbi:MAG: response regulator [Eubacterium sp.]
MNIIAVDDERLALQLLIHSINEALPEAQAYGFRSGEEAMSFCRENSCEIAFLDIDMNDMDGITLAKHLKKINPKVNIIFVTAYNKYAMEAHSLHSSGYMMKPATKERIEQEVKNLRYPVCNAIEKRVKIQTFGNFEIYVDGKPLNMGILKCRECLAYLVDRKGARVTARELATLLWEDRPYDKRSQNNVYRVMSDTMRYLKNMNIADIIVKSRGEMAIDTEKVDCDYYHFLQGEVSQINAFQGEYMSNYSWAELTLGELVKTELRLKKKIFKKEK